MCLAPDMLPDGRKVGCRKCWQCQRRKIDDWAGRIIAESKSSPFTYYLTLTYGRDKYGDSDHVRAAVLTYSDVQKYMKRVRKNLGKARYFVAGEYGDERGRAHWHLILFTDRELVFVDDEGNEVAPIFDTEKVNQGHWKDGFTYIEHFHEAQAYYCCKYVVKDYYDNSKTSRYGMSKKPPLGDRFFRAMADAYVQQGVAPQDLLYTHPEVVRKNGQRRKFMMTGKTAENFCAYFVDEWRKTYPLRHEPESEVIMKYLDAQATAELDALEFERREKIMDDINDAIDELRQEGFGDVATTAARAFKKKDRTFTVWHSDTPTYYTFDPDTILQNTSKVKETAKERAERIAGKKTFHNTEHDNIPF